MSPADILTLAGGSSGGVALVVLALFITGYIVPGRRAKEIERYYKEQLSDVKEERDEWKQTAVLERQRADGLAATGAVVRDVMIGLRKELSQ